MTTTIQIDAAGQSQVFRATRPIRNSDHANGTIPQGAKVFFLTSDGAVDLAYAQDGSPTNGNQYATFPSLAEAEAFVARVGLEDGQTCAYCGAEDLPSEVPSGDDDAAWERLAGEHGADCEWITTRAHRLDA